MTSVALIIITGFSCNQGRLTGEYYLTKEIMEEIPFNGFETIRFITDTNKTIEMTAESRVGEIIKSYTDHSESNYYLWEREYISFRNENYSMSLVIQAMRGGIDGVRFNFFIIDGEYYFTASFKQFGDSYEIIDSMLVNSVWLTDIYYDSVSYVPPGPIPIDLHNYPVKSYYTKTLGVVRIDFSDNTIWELEDIDW